MRLSFRRSRSLTKPESKSLLSVDRAHAGFQFTSTVTIPTNQLQANKSLVDSFVSFQPTRLRRNSKTDPSHPLLLQDRQGSHSFQTRHISRNEVATFLTLTFQNCKVYNDYILAAPTQEALIWSLAHTSCGALGEPEAKPARGSRFLFLSDLPKTRNYSCDFFTAIKEDAL